MYVALPGTHPLAVASPCVEGGSREYTPGQVYFFYAHVRLQQVLGLLVMS